MSFRSIFVAATAGIVVSTAAALYAVHPVRSSDHQDTLQLLSRPGADITDMYVFPAKNPKDVVFALDIHPLIPQGLGESYSFDPGVLYQIKIDTVGDYREHTVLQFKATGSGAAQRIALYGPAPAIAGTTSTMAAAPLGQTTLNGTSNLRGGVSFFAGVRKDPFYFDLTQFFKIDPDRSALYHKTGSIPPQSATCFAKTGTDFFKDFNVLSLVVEVPRSSLMNSLNHGRINVWSTASLSDPSTSGKWHQVERWGRPAVKEALEPFNLHDTSNRAEPYDDPTLEGAIYKTMTTAKPAGPGRSPAIGNALAHLLVPDEMQVNLAAAGPATYLGVETKGKSGLPVGIVRIVPDTGLKGFKSSLRNGARQFGGRDPNSPVIDLSLGAIYGSIVSKVGLAHDDRAETPCLTSDGVKPTTPTLDGFPYLARAT